MYVCIEREQLLLIQYIPIKKLFGIIALQFYFPANVIEWVKYF